MFKIIDYKDGQSCALCDKEANLIVTCEKGTFTAKPVCAKCLARQCKMRAAKPEADRHNPDKAPVNSPPVTAK